MLSPCKEVIFYDKSGHSSELSPPHSNHHPHPQNTFSSIFLRSKSHSNQLQYAQERRGSLDLATVPKTLSHLENHPRSTSVVNGTDFCGICVSIGRFLLAALEVAMRRGKSKLCRCSEESLCSKVSDVNINLLSLKLDLAKIVS